MQARKTLLFEGARPWIKKDGDEDFDILKGCFDGAEICDLAGIYILSKLTNIMNKEDMGLYCDDGPGIFKNISRPEIERKKSYRLRVQKIWIIECSCHKPKNSRFFRSYFPP